MAHYLDEHGTTHNFIYSKKNMNIVWKRLQVVFTDVKPKMSVEKQGYWAGPDESFLRRVYCWCDEVILSSIPVMVNR